MVLRLNHILIATYQGIYNNLINTKFTTMKTNRFIRLIVYHAFFVGALSCTPDEINPEEILPSKISFKQAQYIINSEDDSILISLDLSSSLAANGFVEVALLGDLLYDQEYTTIPRALNSKILLELTKGLQTTSFIVARNALAINEEKTLLLSLNRPSSGIVLGNLTTASIKFMHHVDTLNEVNFSAEEASISEDNAEGLTVGINLSAQTSKSESLKILMSISDNKVYGTHFYTTPHPVLNEISLEIPPQTNSTTFKIFPIDDQMLLVDYQVTFTIVETTDGIHAGAQNSFIATIKEDDQAVGETHSISKVRAQFENHENDWFIATDYFIEGVITSGTNVLDNKTAYIQDETGGILIRFFTPNTLKLGDKIRLNLINGTGRIINDQKSIDGLSPGNKILLRENIVVEAETITVAQFHSGNYEGKRVKLENVEFINADGVVTFAGSHIISQNGATAVVMTYPSASFSTTPLPVGNVSVSGIVGDWGRLMPQVYSHDILK